MYLSIYLSIIYHLSVFYNPTSKERVTHFLCILVGIWCCHYPTVGFCMLGQLFFSFAFPCHLPIPFNKVGFCVCFLIASLDFTDDLWAFTISSIYKPFVSSVVCTYFIQTWSLDFHGLRIVCTRTKFVISMKSSSSFFRLVDHTFGINSKNPVDFWIGCAV